jgi:hypothetical protein
MTHAPFAHLLPLKSIEWGGGKKKVKISILNETPHKEDNYFDECKFLENHSLLY